MPDDDAAATPTNSAPTLTKPPGVNGDLSWREDVRQLLADHCVPEDAQKVNALLDKVIAATIQADPERPRFKIYSAADALEPQPPVEWIIENLIAPGATQLWAGEGGSKKTWSLLDMAVCVAQGQDWLGMKTKQAPVLIIDEESGPRRMARRLGAVLRGHFAGPETPVHYVSLAMFNLSGGVDIEHLRDIVEQLGAKLVIIDALIDVMPGIDENAAGEVAPVFQGLRLIAEDFQCTIIVIHHHNKIGKYRGSTAMKGHVDYLINVSSKPNEDKVEFECEKSRDAEEFKWAAIPRWVDDTFDMIRAEHEPERQVFGKGEQYVLRYLRDNPGATVRDIMDHADACAPTTARTSIYNLVKKNMLVRCDVGGNGETARYKLTEEAASQPW